MMAKNLFVAVSKTRKEIRLLFVVSDTYFKGYFTNYFLLSTSEGNMEQ